MRGFVHRLVGLVVEHDGDVGVLEQGVGGEHGVVRLDDRGGGLRGRVDVAKPSLDLGHSRRLAAVVDGEVPPPTAL